MTGLFETNVTIVDSAVHTGIGDKKCDNGVRRYINKLLIKILNVGMKYWKDFHRRINSAGARSSNGAGVPLTFVSGGRSGRRTWLSDVRCPDVRRRAPALLTLTIAAHAYVKKYLF